MKMSPPSELSIVAQSQHISTLRSFVERVCLEHEISRSICQHLVLVVEEACANIIEHGYVGLKQGSIKVSIQVEQRQVVVTIMDTGHAFDPTTFPPPDLTSDWEERPVGGLGIYFINQLMDEVVYHPDPQNGNQLTLIKHLSVQEKG